LESGPGAATSIQAFRSHDRRGSIEQEPDQPCHERGEFERFFRIAAGLDVDKQDLKRYSDFINQKVYDLLLRAEAAAKANGRVIIEPFDLPITKGLQESIHEFRKIDEKIELQPILDQLTGRPPLDLAYGEDTETQLPEVVAG
jgi:hypothetical protein